MIRIILFFLFIVIIFVLVIVTVLLGAAYGIGWLLIQFLPFTLFESVLLAMLALLGMVYIGIFLLNLTRDPSIGDNSFDYDDEDEDEDEDEDDMFPIPMHRFTDDEEMVSGEEIMRFTLANGFYLEAVEDKTIRGRMSDQQLQELAIRLNDVIIPVLKRRQHVKRLSITLKLLVSQMKRMNMKPYDDEILALAVDTTNDILELSPGIARISRTGSWNLRRRTPPNYYD